MPPKRFKKCKNMRSARAAGLAASQRVLRDEVRRGTRCQSMAPGCLELGASRWTWPPRTSGAEPARRPRVLASNSSRHQRKDIKALSIRCPFRGSVTAHVSAQTLRRRPRVSCQRTTDTACGTAKRQNGKAPLSSPQAAEGTVGSTRSPFDAVLRNSFRMLQLPASTLHMLPPRI